MGGKSAEVKKLESAEVELKREISALKNKLEYAQFRMAELLCPYRAGDRIRVNRGIGVHGLKVERVSAPDNSCEGNRWRIDTFAYSKDGELTKRTVAIEESAATGGSPVYLITKEE